MKRQHNVHTIHYVIYSSLEIEEFQQVVLRREWLCLCGRLTAKNILTLMCIHPDKVCKCSGVLHFNFLHQSMECAELLVLRNAEANPPSFPFLQLFFLFFVINLLQHSQCTEQNCLFFFTAAASTVGHCSQHYYVYSRIHRDECRLIM